MSIYFLLDGYNFIETHIDHFADTLRKNRNILEKLIAINKPEGSSNNKITVVYDGQPGITNKSNNGVDVIFSCGEDADCKIIKLVKKYKNPAQISVITNDKTLQRHVKDYGAKVMTTQIFIKKIFPEKKKKVRKNKELNNEVKDKITSEFEEIWL